MPRRNPHEKLPPEQKSRTYSIRLDPKNIDDIWVIDAIEQYIKREESDIKTMFKDLLALYDGNPIEHLTVNARDVADMITTIRELKEMLESGVLMSSDSGGGGRAKSRRKPKEIEYSETMQNTFDKFVNRGFSAAELSDEDED